MKDRLIKKFETEIQALDRELVASAGEGMDWEAEAAGWLKRLMIRRIERRRHEVQVELMRLQREISQIVTTQEMKESLLDQGSIAIGSPPEELNALIRSEYALWSRVVKAGNVRVE